MGGLQFHTHASDMSDRITEELQSILIFFHSALLLIHIMPHVDSTIPPVR
jgi:hypothetical protein